MYVGACNKVNDMRTALNIIRSAKGILVANLRHTTPDLQQRQDAMPLCREELQTLFAAELTYRKTN